MTVSMIFLVSLRCNDINSGMAVGINSFCHPNKAIEGYKYMHKDEEMTARLRK